MLLASQAHADALHELALDRDVTPLLGGALAVRLADGAQLDGDAAAHVDWGDARLVIVARDLGDPHGQVRDQIALALRDDGEPCAPIARLAVGRTALAFAAMPRAPRRLVYAAFAADRAGRLLELAFYGDASWAPLAARIATTLSVREQHVQPRPSALVAAGCALVADLSELPPAQWSFEFEPVTGTFHGHAVTWSEWRDNIGFHAEAVTPKERVLCAAQTRKALDAALTAVR